MENLETIAAISTAPGTGGIGVVRVSGWEARAVVEPYLRMEGQMEAGRARFARFLDPATVGREEEPEVLDEVVVTYFAGPRSYTGEDVVEVSAHGAPVVLRAILQGCLRSGARLAEPGEFTRRAFLSGRLDLTQAEAVNDLIQATTLHQARTAASQMGGALSREIGPVKERLIGLIATLEAGIDFAEDDIDVMPAGEVVAAIGRVGTALERLERSFAYGRVVRDGVRLAIVGRPNAGKSSLFNALLERERAIVTAAPGTTRDTVTETMSLDGIPLELTDTAGLRVQEGDAGHARGLDEAEVLGIERSRQAMADADVVLLVVDGTAPLHEEDRRVLAERDERTLRVVVNKSDLFGPDGDGRAWDPAKELGGKEWVETSTRTGEGVGQLREMMLGMVRVGAPEREGGMVTNVRQHAAVTEAIAAMREGRAAAEAGLPHEVLLLDLHRGLRALDELTGSTTTEEILALIFSSFCIGK